MSDRSPRPPVPSLALTAARAAAALDMSPDHFREHVLPELRWVRRGRKKVVDVRELQRWLDENAAMTLEGDR
jgi:hypothetical protein